MGELTNSSQELQQELDRLREWSGEGRRVPRLISPPTIVSGAIFIASVAAGLLLAHPHPAVLLTAILAGLISAAAAVVSGIDDLVLIHSRRLHNPDALADYFFRCLRHRRHTAAAAAVSGHAGPDWQAGFVRDWKQRLGDSRIAGAAVKKSQDVAVDMVYLRIRVDLKPGSAVEQIDVRKLAVLRRGRWYFVNGFSNGIHDRRLLRAVKGTGFYEPGDDWEGQAP